MIKKVFYFRQKKFRQNKFRAWGGQPTACGHIEPESLVLGL